MTPGSEDGGEAPFDFCSSGVDGVYVLQHEDRRSRHHSHHCIMHTNLQFHDCLCREQQITTATTAAATTTTSNTATTTMTEVLTIDKDKKLQVFGFGI